MEVFKFKGLSLDIDGILVLLQTPDWEWTGSKDLAKIEQSLKRLVNEGLLRKITTPSGIVRYERNAV